MNEPYYDKAYRRKFSFKRKFIFIPFALGAFALISFIVMQLWNHLLPDILHTGTINYWQAVGLLILSKILFGFGHGGHRGGPWMRNKMEHFKNMSPEERERFKEHMRARCGHGWDRHRGGFEQDQPAESAAKPAEDTSKPAE